MQYSPRMHQPTVLTKRESIQSEPHSRALGWVILNRPQVRNALIRSMLVEARNSIEQFVHDTSVRAIVLTGASEGDNAAFCSGADLRATLIEDPNIMEKLEEYLEDFHSLIRTIWNAPKPIVAAVDGPAVGFGCDLALVCDFRIASERAYFQESFVKIGLMPDGGGTGLLPRLIGLSRAMESIFFATKIEAERAFELGLVMQLVPDDMLHDVVRETAIQLAEGPPIAFAEAKRAMHASSGISIENILAHEREGQLRCLRSQDTQEAILAWAQKRKPQFQGR